MKYDIIAQDKDERSEYISETMRALAPMVHNSRPQTDRELEARIEEYVRYCAETGSLPLLEKMKLYVGVDYRTFDDWAAGRALGTGPRCQEICRRAKEICSAFEAQAAMDNKVNPVVYIYRSKAHYGFKDNPEVTVVNIGDQRSKEELLEEAKALEGLNG